MYIRPKKKKQLIVIKHLERKSVIFLLKRILKKLYVWYSKQ